MKKSILPVLAMLLCIALPSAALSVDNFHYAYGQWSVEGDRLVQSDLLAGMARVDIPFPQSGEVEYDFNVRYEDGGTDDLHAGFGIHLFVGTPAPGKAWGNDKSYLLWLNYDADPSGISAGLSAQIYRSISNHEMKLIADYDLNRYAPLLTGANSARVVPVKIIVNGDTGDVWIADPLKDNWGYQFNLGNTEPLKGNYISLRTNSGSFSFGY